MFPKKPDGTLVPTTFAARLNAKKAIIKANLRLLTISLFI